MAFATSNVRKSVIGNMRVMHGTWSSLAGDASGTVAVNGANPVLVNFESTDATSNQTRKFATSVATGMPSTVTVYPQEAVTTGKFTILYK